MTQIFDHLVLQGYDRQVLRREQEKEKRIEVASEIRRTRRRSTTVVLEYQIRFEEGQDSRPRMRILISDSTFDRDRSFGCFATENL